MDAAQKCRLFFLFIAHLEHDKDQQYERLIREVLRDFKGAQLLQFDRTISLDGTKPEEKAEKGHTQARQYLEDSGAHVLIWGLVLRHDDKSAPHLYWTTLQDSKRAEAPYQPENFKMPDLFWNDLAEVLRLVVATHHSQFLAQRGHFTADQHTPFITRVRQLLAPRTNRQDWSKVQFVLGNALLMLGEQIGTNKPLEEAITTYQTVLTVWTKERVPLDWAAVQNHLGLALRNLGEREPGTARLTAAVEAHRAALPVWTRERAFLDWATTQGNLGNTLRSLGTREPGTAHLTAAVEAHRAALTVRTRERVPLGWAATQNNLGNALLNLDEREQYTGYLEAAGTAYQAALTVRTRERVPLQWAESQANLSLTLRTLGERKKDATLICEALGKQLMAWEIFSIGSPYNATSVAKLAKGTIASLKEYFQSLNV